MYVSKLLPRKQLVQLRGERAGEGVGIHAQIAAKPGLISNVVAAKPEKVPDLSGQVAR